MQGHKPSRTHAVLTLWSMGLLTALAPAQTTLTVAMPYRETRGEAQVDTVRTYYLRMPPGADAAHRVPLLIDLHGYSNTALGQMQLSGFRYKAQRDTFAVAWPQGRDNSWNSGGTCCGTALKQKLDDVDFLKAVVTHIRASQPVDGGRVYVTGHSNGGAMVERLAAEAGDVFAAAADFSGFLSVQPGPARNVPLFKVHGLQDSVVLYQGEPDIPSVDSTFSVWRRAQGCSDSLRIDTLDAFTQSVCRVPDCGGKTLLKFCAVAGDHMIYNNTPRLDLTDLAWDFLKGFRLENPPEVTGLLQGRTSPKRRLKRSWRDALPPVTGRVRATP